MKKNETHSTTTASQNLALVIYVVAFLAIVAFIGLKLNRMSSAIPQGAGPVNDPSAIAESIRKQSVLSATSGICSQIQVLLSTFIVLAVPRKGYFIALILNILNAGLVIMNVVMRGMISSIPGTIIPISTVILITIIHIFSNRVTQKTEELTNSYEQLMNTNRIIKEKDEKLSYLAYYDILTGLPNRHLFIEKIDQTILNNSDMQFTVILADIDNFKNINNIYGNSTGDTLLATYAEKLKTFCEDSVFLGRIGGNEYAFIIQGNLTEVNILNYIDKIKNIISEPVKIGNDVISTTASYGIASYPNNALSSSDMLKCVNSAVSYAKANGKNRLCFYDQH